MSRSTKFAPAVIVAISALMAACSTGGSSTTKPAASSGPASLAALEKQAKGEKGLSIYANVPPQFFQPMVTAFNKVYPNIKVTESDLSDQEAFSKYQAEAAQGARTADLIVASAPAPWMQAKKDGVPAPVTPSGLNAFPSWTNTGGGVYVMSAEPVLLVYNPKLVAPSDVPHNYRQLAALATSNKKVKMVSYAATNALNYAGLYGLIHILGANALWTDYTALAPVTTTYDDGLSGLQQVVQGGAGIGYMASGLAQGAVKQYPGLAAYTFMQDATPLVPRAMAMTAKAASPASAQLFMNFIYSKAGQDALCAGGFEATMNGYQPANGCTASLTSLQSQVPAGTTYLVPINDDVLTQQSAITDKWKQVFHR